MNNSSSLTTLPKKKLPTWAVAVISVVVGLIVIVAIAVGIWYSVRPVGNSPSELNLKSFYSVPDITTRRVQIQTTWNAAKERVYNLTVKGYGQIMEEVLRATSPSVLDFEADETIGAFDPASIDVTLDMLPTDTLPAQSATVQAVAAPGEVFSACDTDEDCAKSSGFCNQESICQWPTQSGPLELAATYNAPTKDTRLITVTWRMVSGVVYDLTLDVPTGMKGTELGTFPMSLPGAKNPTLTPLRVGTQISEQARPADVTVTIKARTKPLDGPASQTVRATAVPGGAYSSCESNAGCPLTKNCQLSNKTCQWPNDVAQLPESFFDAPSASWRTITTIWEPQAGRSYSVTIDLVPGSRNVITASWLPSTSEKATSPSILELNVPLGVSAAAVPSDFVVTITALATDVLPANAVTVTVQAVPGHQFSACSLNTDCVMSQLCDPSSKTCAARSNMLQSFFTESEPLVRQFETTWVSQPGRTYTLIFEVVPGSETVVFPDTFPMVRNNVTSTNYHQVIVGTQVRADARPRDFTVTLKMSGSEPRYAESTTVAVTAKPGSIFSNCKAHSYCSETKYCSPLTSTCSAFPAPDFLEASYAMNPRNPTLVQISVTAGVSPMFATWYPKGTVMNVAVNHNGKLLFQQSQMAFQTLDPSNVVPDFVYVYNRIGNENVAPESFSLVIVFSDPVSGASAAPINLSPTPVDQSAYARCTPDSISCAPRQCVGGTIVPATIAGASCETAVCCDAYSICTAVSKTCESALRVNRTLATDSYAQFTASGTWEVMISGSTDKRFSRNLSIVRSDTGAPQVVIGNYDDQPLFEVRDIYKTPRVPTVALDASTLKLLVVTTDTYTDQQDAALYTVFGYKCSEVNQRCTRRQYCAAAICTECSYYEDMLKSFELKVSQDPTDSQLASVTITWAPIVQDQKVAYTVELFSSDSDLLVSKDAGPDQYYIGVDVNLVQLGAYPFAIIRGKTSCAPTRTVAVTQCDGFPSNSIVTAVVLAFKPYETVVRVKCVTERFTVGTAELTLRAYTSVMDKDISTGTVLNLQGELVQQVLLSAPPFHPILQLNVIMNTICGSSSYNVPVSTADVLPPCGLLAATTMHSTQDDRLYVGLQQDGLVPGAAVSACITLSGADPPGEWTVPLVTSLQTGQVTAPVEIPKGAMITDLRVFFSATDTPIMSQPFKPQQCATSPVLPVTELTCVLDVSNSTLHLKWVYASPNKGNKIVLNIVQGGAVFGTYPVPDLTTRALRITLDSITTNNPRWYKDDVTAHLVFQPSDCEGNVLDFMYKTETGITIAQPPLVAPSGSSAVLLVNYGLISVLWGVPDKPPPPDAFTVVTLLDENKVTLDSFTVPTMQCVLFKTTLLRPTSVTIQTRTPQLAQSSVESVQLASECVIAPITPFPEPDFPKIIRDNGQTLLVFKPVENISFYKVTFFTGGQGSTNTEYEAVVLTAGGDQLASLPCLDMLELPMAVPARNFLYYDNSFGSYVYGVRTSISHNRVSLVGYDKCFCIILQRLVF